MEIPNYDLKNEKKDFKQLHRYMPKDTFRMLLASPSGGGKTNLLYHMLTKPLLYFDQVHLYAKNLEQQKYQDLINLFQDVSDQVGYDIIKTSNDTIMPVNYINNSGQKIVIFDDFVTEKKQKPIIDYFIQGRHKNCAVIYLSQSFNGCPKDIRLNCSPFCIYNFPSSNEQNLISRELQYSPKIMHAQEVAQEHASGQKKLNCGLSARTFKAQEDRELAARSRKKLRT